MIRWFTDNRVAANLLMIAIMLGGVLSLPLLDREVMPGIPLDMIQIDVDYPGATPAEIEERICIRIEEAIHDLEGIKSINQIIDYPDGASVREITKLLQNCGTELETSFAWDASSAALAMAKARGGALLSDIRTHSHAIAAANAATKIARR